MAFLPMRAKEVQNLLNRGKSSFLPKDDVNKIEFIDNRIHSLQLLYTDLVAMENRFYKDIGINQSGAAGLKELKKKIEEINNNSFSAEDVIKRVLADKDIAFTIEAYSNEALQNLLDMIEPSDIATDDDIIEMSDIIKTFNKVIVVKEGKKTSHYFQNAKEKGLNRILEFGYFGSGYFFKDQDFDLKIKESEAHKIDSSIRKKISEAIITIKNLHMNTLTKDTLRKAVNKYLVSTANNTILQKYVNYECSPGRNDKYDIVANENSLKGYIQEVWSNAVLNYLFPNQTSIPTGNLKTKINSQQQEIGIDAVLKEFNFQIKHFTFDDEGKYTIRQSDKGAGSLLQRGGFLSMGEILLEIFASYQFNQPFREIQPKGPNVMSVSEYENNIYSGFQDIINNETISKLLFSHIDYLIRLQQKFNVEANNDNLFITPKEYRNTFFIINDDFVPASAIIRALIKELQNVQDKLNYYMTLEVTNIGAPKKGDGTFERLVQNTRLFSRKKYTDKVWPIDESTAIKLADYIKISYEMTFDFPRILKHAYRMISTSSVV